MKLDQSKKELKIIAISLCILNVGIGLYLLFEFMGIANVFNQALKENPDSINNGVLILGAIFNMPVLIGYVFIIAGVISLLSLFRINKSNSIGLAIRSIIVLFGQLPLLYSIFMWSVII